MYSYQSCLLVVTESQRTIKSSGTFDIKACPLRYFPPILSTPLAHRKSSQTLTRENFSLQSFAASETFLEDGDSLPDESTSRLNKRI